MLPPSGKEQIVLAELDRRPPTRSSRRVRALLPGLHARAVHAQGPASTTTWPEIGEPGSGGSGIRLREKGAANGVATLDARDLLPVAELPASVGRASWSSGQNVVQPYR